MEKYEKTKDTSNWFKFEPSQIPEVKDMVEKIGGSYQIPILAEKGSFIVWLSTLIHSAKLQDHCEHPTQEDPYNGWRGVIYVCYRPKEEFNKKDLKTRQKAFEENRTTNHWGNHMFDKKPGSYHMYKEKKHPELEAMMKDPKLVYDKIGKPVLNDFQKSLIGL